MTYVIPRLLTLLSCLCLCICACLFLYVCILTGWFQAEAYPGGLTNQAVSTLKGLAIARYIQSKLYDNGVIATLLSRLHRQSPTAKVKLQGANNDLSDFRPFRHFFDASSIYCPVDMGPIIERPRMVRNKQLLDLTLASLFLLPQSLLNIVAIIDINQFHECESFSTSCSIGTQLSYHFFCVLPFILFSSSPLLFMFVDSAAIYIANDEQEMAEWYSSLCSSTRSPPFLKS
jgi:hypothetical protein